MPKKCRVRAGPKAKWSPNKTTDWSRGLYNLLLYLLLLHRRGQRGRRRDIRTQVWESHWSNWWLSQWRQWRNWRQSRTMKGHWGNSTGWSKIKTGWFCQAGVSIRELTFFSIILSNKQSFWQVCTFFDLVPLVFQCRFCTVGEWASNQVPNTSMLKVSSLQSLAFFNSPSRPSSSLHFQILQIMQPYFGRFYVFPSPKHQSFFLGQFIVSKQQ